MGNYTGINHLAFATRDLDATIRFWRDLLGMRLIYGYGQLGYRQYFFEVSPTDLVAFFEWPAVEPLPRRTHGTPVKGPFAFDHVSIGVASEEMLWEVIGKLSGAGFPASDVIDHGFIRSVYSFDPNGIPIEFSWPVEDFDIRHRPVFADTVSLASPGSEPLSGKWPPPEAVPKEERFVVRGVGWEHFLPLKTEEDVT